MAKGSVNGAKAEKLVLVVGAILLLGARTALSLPSEKNAPPKGVRPTQAGRVPEVEVRLGKLGQCLAAYKASGDPVTWDAFWKEFKQIVQTASSQHADSVPALKSVSGINEIGLRVTDAPGLKIFSFTRVPESQQILVEWKEMAAVKAPVKKGRKVAHSKPLVGPVMTKIQALSCSSSVLVNDGRFLAQVASEPSSQAKASSPLRAGNQKFLVLCGSDKKSGLAWLQGYRLAEGHWIACPDLFSGVPPYLLQNIQGKPAFSGSSLIFTSDAGKSPSEAASDKQDGQSSGYKIVLRFFGDHYAFDTKSSLDAAMAIALQFSQAIQKGRVDLVKAWLIDAKLASIPSYLGLYNRPANAPAFKLIAMAPPLNGSSRFRLITYEKNDLIFDVGKIKSQWAVKGLFIAPPDAFAKKLMSQVAQPMSGPAESKTGIQNGEN